MAVILLPNFSFAFSRMLYFGPKVMSSFLLCFLFPLPPIRLSLFTFLVFIYNFSFCSCCLLFLTFSYSGGKSQNIRRYCWASEWGVGVGEVHAACMYFISVPTGKEKHTHIPPISVINKILLLVYTFRIHSREYKVQLRSPAVQYCI